MSLVSVTECGSIKRFELAQLPVFERAIGQVSSDNKGNLLLSELFLSNSNRVPVHIRDILVLQVQRSIF